MNRLCRLLLLLCFFAGPALTVPASAENSPGLSPGESDKEKIDKAHGERPYSPYADRNYPSRPLFGDTHLHTGFSMDAGVFGARLRPADAYRFARGEQVTFLVDGPVAARAADLHDHLRIAIEVTVAVHVVLGVAVDAVHPVLEVDIRWRLVVAVLRVLIGEVEARVVAVERSA